MIAEEIDCIEILVVGWGLGSVRFWFRVGHGTCATTALASALWAVRGVAVFAEGTSCMQATVLWFSVWILEFRFTI